MVPDYKPLQPSSLAQLTLYFLKLGTIGFGGPIALAAYMERNLVEERGWITELDYKQGLALAQLAPGPLAAQLAIYLGYVHSGILGATLVGLAFVLPSFLMVVAISAAYVQYGGLRWMQVARPIPLVPPVIRAVDVGRHGPCPRAHGGGMVRHWCRKLIVCDRGGRRSTTDHEPNRTRLRRKRPS